MNNKELETLLRRAQIGEPSTDLRSRLLDAARERRTHRTWQQWLPELAAAALLLLSIGQLSRPEVWDRERSLGHSSPVAEASPDDQILASWQASFREEPRLAAYLEIYLSYLDRAAVRDIVRDDVRSAPFGTGKNTGSPF